MRIFLTAGILALITSGCTVWSDDRDRRRGDQWVDVQYPTTNVTPSNNVLVDPDLTMNAVGGAGVGVFVEYKKGGAWRIALSCDTAQSTKACTFKLKVTGAAVSEIERSDLPVGDVTANATTIVVDTAVGREIPVLTFQSTQGSPITIDAAVDQVRDSGMFFYISGGQVRGGNGAAVTNPLTFTPAAP